MLANLACRTPGPAQCRPLGSCNAAVASPASFMVCSDLPSSQCPTPVPHLSHHAVMAWCLPDVFPFHPCPLFSAFFCCKPIPWEMSCHWMLCIRDVWCVMPGAYNIVQAYKPGTVPSPSRRAPKALCCILNAILARPTYYLPVSRADCKWSRQDVSSKSACISHMEDCVSINTPPAAHAHALVQINLQLLFIGWQVLSTVADTPFIISLSDMMPLQEA